MVMRARGVYQEYRRWSEEVGEEAMVERSFCQRVAGMRFERKRRNDNNWYAGVGLRVEDGG